MWVSISYCRSAVLAAELPQPTSRCSSTTTACPCCENSSAMSAPVMPPPTIATSQRTSSVSGGNAVIRPFLIAQKGYPLLRSIGC